MALTKTTYLSRVEIQFPEGDGDADLVVTHAHVIDDPDDDQLPVRTQSTDVVHRNDPEGNATDISGLDQAVQDICAAVWTD